MNRPTVSIIIPCFNYGNFLPQAVGSVLVQTFVDWECIIVDDGSTDDTKMKALDLEKADKRVKYHYKTNGGLSSARNFGLSRAAGQFISFLDADDLFQKEKLAEQVGYLEKNTNVDIVYGKAMFFEKNDTSTLYQNKQMTALNLMPEVGGQGHEMISRLVRGNITVVSAPLIRSNVFEKVGHFDESYRSYEDWHFWFRCAVAGSRFAYHAKPLICTLIRFGHESMMSDKKKLARASLQIRWFMTNSLPFKFKVYNYYRLVRSYLKLLSTS